MKTMYKELIETAKEIVNQANMLRLKYAPDFSGHVSYCCYFSQNEDEFFKIKSLAEQVGTLAKSTNTGPVFVVPDITTDAGILRVFKVRKPDPTRPEKGDADFGLDDYVSFKFECLDKPGFKLIERADFEMIELVDPEFEVRAYFSNPPVEEHAGIREALADSAERK